MTQQERSGDRTMIQVLGPVCILSQDGPVRLPGGRFRTLLALLAVHHGELVPCDRIVDAAWHGQPPPTATTQVHGLVSALRRALPPTAIETHGNTYLLRAGPIALDLAAFQSST